MTTRIRPGFFSRPRRGQKSPALCATGAIFTPLCDARTRRHAVLRVSPAPSACLPEGPGPDAGGEPVAPWSALVDRGRTGAAMMAIHFSIQVARPTADPENLALPYPGLRRHHDQSAPSFPGRGVLPHRTWTPSRECSRDPQRPSRGRAGFSQPHVGGPTSRARSGRALKRRPAMSVITAPRTGRSKNSNAVNVSGPTTGAAGSSPPGVQVAIPVQPEFNPAASDRFRDVQEEALERREQREPVRAYAHVVAITVTFSKNASTDHAMTRGGRGHAA